MRKRILSVILSAVTFCSVFVGDLNASACTVDKQPARPTNEQIVMLLSDAMRDVDAILYAGHKDEDIRNGSYDWARLNKEYDSTKKVSDKLLAHFSKARTASFVKTLTRKINGELCIMLGDGGLTFTSADIKSFKYTRNVIKCKVYGVYNIEDKSLVNVTLKYENNAWKVDYIESLMF